MAATNLVVIRCWLRLKECLFLTFPLADLRVALTYFWCSQLQLQFGNHGRTELRCVENVQNSVPLFPLPLIFQRSLQEQQLRQNEIFNEELLSQIANLTNGQCKFIAPLICLFCFLYRVLKASFWNPCINGNK